jgi:hypothetical protein
LNELEVVYLQSLWNILSLKRVILLTQFGQNPFDKIKNNYRVLITICKADGQLQISEDHNNDKYFYNPDNEDYTKDDKTITTFILEGKKIANSSNLLNFLHHIYHLINFKLIPNKDRQIADDDDDFDYSFMNIHDVISEQIEMSYNSDNNNVNQNIFSINEYNLTNIKVKHVYHLWNIMVDLYLNSTNNNQ